MTRRHLRTGTVTALAITSVVATLFDHPERVSPSGPLHARHPASRVAAH